MTIISTKFSNIQFIYTNEHESHDINISFKIKSKSRHHTRYRFLFNSCL